ncbi:MAG: hypothetical protein A2452_04805 [Candidatus Firestonebacteria bacterium RIFOXYC2_FULL_39_67]|nr:MAG: hypothetical protein A2536_11340 [Candidatus Firestonebacteria bacterium RIFOXYD2_FULL_39_29]OGF53253.1 MAG: hypothetical protein A2497_02655 [Candidatus Firestonebacteria bacterium RifOxyC12_full_39_7]OGF55797.1 MAG: hypothetical protein A2452_04805 [Candidatus Firestonebacteria bacterium RIFOXYC2_FULL_39_67]
MEVGEILLKKHVDEDMLNFIKNYINTFEKLDIVRFFGLNSSSRVDVETLTEVTNNKKEEISKAIKELVKAHVLEEVDVDGKKLYELSQNKNTLELVKRFISYYSKNSIRMLIIGYLLNKSIETKR